MSCKTFVRHDNKYRVRTFVHIHNVQIVLARHRHNAVVRKLLHIAVYFRKIRSKRFVRSDKHGIYQASDFGKLVASLDKIVAKRGRIFRTILRDIVVDVEQHELAFVDFPFDTILTHCKDKTEDKVSRSLFPSRLISVLHGAKRIYKVLRVFVYLVFEFLHTRSCVPVRQEHFARSVILAVFLL